MASGQPQWISRILQATMASARPNATTSSQLVEAPQSSNAVVNRASMKKRRRSQQAGRLFGDLDEDLVGLDHAQLDAGTFFDHGQPLLEVVDLGGELVVDALGRRIAGLLLVDLLMPAGDVAQVFFDAQQLVVLGDAVAAAHRTGLDLAGVGAHRDVGNGRVFGFARTVRDHGRIAGHLGHFDGLEGFGQGADLVDLDQDRVGDALVDAFLQDLGVGHEQVVTHDLDLLAQAFGQVLPAVPVAFGHAVFDADDGVLVAPGGQDVGPLFSRQHQAFAFEVVLAVLVELAGGAVQAQGDLFAGHETRLVDGFQDQLDGGLMAGHAGGKAAFVAHGGAHALVVDDLLEGVEHLGTVAHGFTEGGGAHRDDHQLLQIEVVVGVRATVDDVHHRHRQLHAAHAAEVAVQGQARFLGGGTGHGHGHGQHGVGTQAALVVGAVQVDQGLVQEGLLGGVQAQHGLGDLGVDVFNGLEHALAQVARLVAVAQFDGFTAAGGGTRGHGGAAHDARFEQDVAFDGGVAAAVQDFTADDVYDCTHVVFFQYKTKTVCSRGAQTPSTTIMRMMAAPSRAARACPYSGES